MNREKAREFQKEKAAREEQLTFRGTQWLCSDCRFILGYVSQDRGEVRMKAKDFFLTVEGGKITHPCRRCGKLNELADEEYLAWKSERKSFTEFLANRKLFEEFLSGRTQFKKFLITKKKEEETKKMGGK